MPGMPRISEKATKIAYKILGIPANIADKKTEKQKEIDRSVVQYDTRFVK